MSLGQCTICGDNAVVVYPLLPGEPRFCSRHHTHKHAGPYGCDLSSSDHSFFEEGSHTNYPKKKKKVKGGNK